MKPEPTPEQELAAFDAAGLRADAVKQRAIDAAHTRYDAAEERAHARYLAELRAAAQRRDEAIRSARERYDASGDESFRALSPAAVALWWARNGR